MPFCIVLVGRRSAGWLFWLLPLCVCVGFGALLGFGCSGMRLCGSVVLLGCDVLDCVDWLCAPLGLGLCGQFLLSCFPFVEFLRCIMLASPLCGKPV